MKFYNADADGLTNTKFPFMYSQGCLPGNFEGDCVAEHLTTSTRHGNYAVIFNSRYGWGYYNDCYWYPYSCGNPWFWGAFGVGYFYMNPWAWNYGDYSYWGGGGGGGSFGGGAQMGSIRLKVKPNNASVYVDGYYAGTVDDFDNSFQKLSLSLGAHKIEISAPGYEPLIVEIDVKDFETITYQGVLVPIR